MRPMSLLRSAVAIALLAMALPAAAAAQIEAGDKRFSLQGNLSKSVSPDGDVDGNLSGEYGVYLTRNFAVKGGAGVTFSGSTALYLAAVGTEYNLAAPGDTKIPFVSLEAGGLFGSGLTAFVVQPGVGAHFFLSRQTSFDLLGLYQWANASAGGASASSSSVEIRLGLSFFFGGGEKR